jgi:hypothetical protein
MMKIGAAVTKTSAASSSALFSPSDISLTGYEAPVPNECA